MKPIPSFALLLALPAVVFAQTPAAAPSPARAPAPAAAPAEAPSATSQIEEQTKALVTKINQRMRAGARSETALAPEIAEFDALLTKYRDQKTETVAQLHFMHATLFMALDNPDRAQQLLKQIPTNFPDTQVAARATQAVAQIEAQAAAKKAKEELAGKAAPELTFNWSSREGLTKLSALKGKVVVLDFWATWCGPCVASFPQVRDLAAHYKDSDVVVLGVTSLQGRVHGLEAKPIDTRNDPAKEKALMNDYIKAKGITWSVVFSEQEVFNPEYGITGIPHMAIIAPDGTVRYNGLHPADDPAGKITKIDALLKEFGKATPKS